MFIYLFRLHSIEKLKQTFTIVFVYIVPQLHLILLITDLDSFRQSQSF